MGISYGGISQLFTAATNPPSLAAISPLSVLDATQTTLYPGGILNTGFAVAWAKERISTRRCPPAPDGRAALGVQADPGGRHDVRGQPGAPRRGGGPDGEDRRQRPLHPGGRRPARPVTFVHKINVPTFMACQWQDEQTGGHCPSSSASSPARTRSGSPSPTARTSTRSIRRRSTAGTTSSSCSSPGEAPIANSALIRAAAPVIYQEAMGITGVTLPPDPIQLQPDVRRRRSPRSSSCRRSACCSTTAPAASQPGHPVPGLRAARGRASRSPAPPAASWYLGAGGALADAPPAAAGATRSPGTPATGRSPTSPATPRPARAASGPRRRRTSGRRTRRAPPSPTSPRRSTANTTVVGGGAV